MPTAPVTARLLVVCPDRPGIVAAVSEFVFAGGGNIIHADQHTDPVEGVFLQRIEWELDGFVHRRDAIGEAFRPIADRFEMAWRVHFSDERARIGVMVSKHGHCVYDLLARHQMGELDADIPVVVSNHPDLAEGAARFGTEFHHLPVTPETKPLQERRVVELFGAHGVDLVVLARYMQIVGPAMVARYARRMINIHHSFLPAFAGARPYHQAHERGVKIIGATAHYVTDELDQGPIIDQDVVRVSHRDSVSDLVHKGRDLEKVVLARAVRLHLEHRVLVYGNKTVVFD